MGLLFSNLSVSQHMLFHLLGAGQPVANFSVTAQTVNESDGIWVDWPVAYSAWTRRREIRLEGMTGALSNFPVMIKLDSTRIDYAETQSAGQDLRFTDNAGTALSYEIENWDEAGTSIAWVKIPTLAAYPTENKIWMYYGNAVASDAQAKTAVWDASHTGVWHLSGNASDSTSNVKNGTETTVTYTAGVASQAVNIGGVLGNRIQLPNSMTVSNVFTISLWFKTTGNGIVLGHASAAYSTVPGAYDPLLYIGTDGRLRGGDYVGSVPGFYSATAVNDGQWHHAALTGSTNTQSLYLDGELVGSHSGTLNMTSMIYNYIGMGYWESSWPARGSGWNSFNGSIDEVSISSTARSSAWVKATYASAADSLASIGVEQTQTSGAALVTVQLNTPAITTVTIPYTVSGTATVGTDHSRASGNLTINGGSSAGSLNARIFLDNLVEGSETAILTLGAPTGATLGPDTVHTVTITDEALSPPDAVDDSYNLTTLSALTLPVLVNDTDANGDTLMITAISSPAAGTAVRVGQAILYTPNGDFGATDSFTYTISDGRGGSDTATVTLNYQIPFTWIGSGANANWTTAANWLGGVVPGAGNTVYFNNQCTTYCDPTVVGAISVAGLNMNTSYGSGTVGMGTHAITVGTAGFNQRAGTFNGGTGTMIVSGTISILGGLFNATSGTTTSQGNFVITNASYFNHNSGLWFQKADTKTWTTPTTSNVEFYDLQFESAGGYFSMALPSGSTVNVLHLLTVGPSAYEYWGFANGTINVYGDIVLSAAGGRGSTLVKIVGTGAQTITGNGTGHLPSLEIAKPSGTLTLVNVIRVDRNFTYTMGTVDPGTSTMQFRGQDGSTRFHNFNGLSLNNVIFSNVNVWTDLSGSTLTVLGSLTMQNAGNSLSNGTVYVKGSVTCGSSTPGTVNVIMDGAAAGNTTATGAYACRGLEVARTGGATVTQTANFLLNTAGQDLTLTSGTYNMAGFSLTVGDVLTVASGAKLLCNGGVLTYGSASVAGEISCGSTIGITWTGLSGDGLWTTAGNWTNNTIPGASDIAIFNGSCTNCNATMNAAVSVKGMVMASAYTGTITQGAGNTVTVGTSGWLQAAGTFAGAASSMTFNGPWVFSGGTFTATSGTLTTKSNITFSGSPVFTHNSGTVLVSGTDATSVAISTGAAAFNNVTFGGLQVTQSLTGTISVYGTFTLSDAYGAGPGALVGTVLAYGDVVAASYGKSGAGLVKVVGSANQTITGVSGATFPGLEIASTGGTVTLSGTIHIKGNYTNTSGAIAVGSSTLLLSGIDATTVTVVPGAVNYNNVTFGGIQVTFSLSGTMTVNGLLTIADTNSLPGFITGGTVNAIGDIVFSNYGKGGTGLIRVAGTGNQTVTGAATASIPNFQVASTGGVVTFVGTFTLRQGYTYTSGTVDAGTSTLNFSPPDTASVTVTPGVPTYHNVTFGGAATSYTMTGTFTVGGTLTLNDGSSGTGSINGGTILASGNVSVLNYGKLGTVLLRIVGSTDQTLSGAAGGYWPEVEIISTGGTVSLSGILYMRKGLAYTSGTVSSGTSTVYFKAADGASATFVPGGVAFNNVTFSGAATTTTISGTLTVNGVLTFIDASSGAGSINSGAISANGDIVYSGYGKLGSAVLTASGSTATTISMATTAWRMPTLMTINKSGGSSLSLLSNIAYTGASQDVTISGGTLDLAGYDLAVADVLTVGAGATLRCNGGDFTSVSLTNSGTVNCPGYSTYEFNWTGAGGDANWSTAGNWAGGAAPSSTSILVFNDTYCGANCNSTISAVASVRGIQVQSPYTGVITQNAAATLTVGSRGMTLAAGTFNQGAAIDLNGVLGFTQSGGTFNAANFATHFTRYSQSGGTFNASSGTLQVGHNFTWWNNDGFVVSGGTFNHGNGTVEFMNSYGSGGNDRHMVIDVPAGGLTFYNLVVNYRDTASPYSNSFGEIATGDTITIANNLTLKNGRLMQGTVLLNGNLDVQCAGGDWSTSDVCADGGSATIQFNGSTAHTYSFQSGARGPYIEVPTGDTVAPAGGTTGAHFGKLKVSGGAFTAPTGVMQIGNDYYYSYTDGFVVSSGTFTHNSGTVEFMGSYGSIGNDRYTTIDAPAGGLQLYDVVMNVRDSVTPYNNGFVEITAGDTVVVNHNLTLKNGRFDGGTIDLYGALDVQCAGGSSTTSDACADGGTAQMRFLGTGSQNVTQAVGSLVPQGSWTVNKTGGSLILGSALGLNGTNQDLTITAGLFDMAGYNLTVNRNISNSGTLKRGNSPTCGTVSQGGSYSGSAATCP